jgi:hypothetical protein
MDHLLQSSQLVILVTTFQKNSKICKDIRNSWCTTGVNNTHDKWAKCVNRWFQRNSVRLFLTTGVGQRSKFVIDVDHCSGKYTTGVYRCTLGFEKNLNGFSGTSGPGIK